MTYNLTGINFHKPQTSNANSKNLFVTGTNMASEMRSSSAFDQKRFNLHSSPNAKHRNPFNHDDKQPNNKLKVYDYMPKINKEKKTVFIDPDKLQDQVLKLKVELNNKNREINMIKVEFHRLEEENKKNNKVIEEFINEATKFSPDINNYLKGGFTSNSADNYDGQFNSNEADGKNEENQFDSKENFDPMKENQQNKQSKMNFTSINPASIIKLREVFMINSLKKQIASFKQLLRVKDEEINHLKSSSKVAKFQILENEYRIKMEEHYQIKENFEKMKDTITFKDNKLKELVDENEYYKTITNKFKSQLDETKDKMRFYQEENLKIMESKKSLEEKQNMNKFANQSFKSQLLTKENELNILREEIKNVEAFRNEKPKIDKAILDFKKQVHSYKEDLERKNQRIKDLEKQNLSNKLAFEHELESLNLNLSKKIKILESENANLRKQDALNKEKLAASSTSTAFLKSSAFLTEAKVDKKETGSIKDFEAKLKALEEERDAEIEKCKRLQLELEEKVNYYSDFDAKIQKYKDDYLKIKEEIEDQKANWDNLKDQYIDKIECTERDNDELEKHLSDYKDKLDQKDKEIMMLKEQLNQKNNNSAKKDEKKKTLVDIPEEKPNEKKKNNSEKENLKEIQPSKEAESKSNLAKLKENPEEKSNKKQAAQDFVTQKSLSTLHEENKLKTKKPLQEKEHEISKTKENENQSKDSKMKESSKDKYKSDPNETAYDKGKKPIKQFDSEKKLNTESDLPKLTQSDLPKVSNENDEDEYKFDEDYKDEESYDNQVDDNIRTKGFGAFKPKNDNIDED